MRPAAGRRPRQTGPLTGLNRRDALAHLLRRAGFGPTPTEVDTAVAQGLAATVNRLVDYEQVPDTFAGPDQSLLDQSTGQIEPLGEWWLGRMMTTSRPLQEKMALFWHSHFATANSKVRHPGLMYRQNQLFRQNALGRFDDILGAVARDPAMLVWLDGRVNTRLAPNENWGRESLELFSIGPGAYIDDDIHANSRAFTGWRLPPATLEPVFAPRLHDAGVKTLLGQTGNWGADDAVRIIAAHPATGPFLAAKLWRFFASDLPPASAVRQLASVYSSSGHSIREVVRTLFSLPEFFASGSRTGHVKSPIEFVTQALRPLGAAAIPLTFYTRALATLGQELFNPPNVGGWFGGTSWINGGTMLGRFNVAAHLTGVAPGRWPAVDVQTVLRDAAPNGGAAFIAYLADRLGVTLTTETNRVLLSYAGVAPPGSRGIVRPGVADSPPAAVALQGRAAGLIHLVLVSPEFQIT